MIYFLYSNLEIIIMLTREYDKMTSMSKKSYIIETILITLRDIKLKKNH